MGEPEKKVPTGDMPYKKKWGNGNRNKKRVGHRPQVAPAKFKGGKEEIDGHYFDCTGYGQSDRFMKTVEKIAGYVGQDYKGGGLTRTKVMTQAPVIVPLPPRPITNDVFDISDYQSKKKISDSKIQNQEENRQKLFSLVWQQCTESMHAKLRAHREYTTIELELNGVGLLRIIKLICFNIEDEKYIPQKVHESKAAFYALKQGRDSDQAYQIKFLNTVQVIEQCGASLGEDPLTRTMVCKALKFQPDTLVASELATISKTVREYTLGAALILGADPERYSGMIRGLKNASLAGRDEWPKNVTEAYSYLSKWEGDDGKSHVTRGYEGTAFISNTATVKDTEPQEWHLKMTCRKCNKLGHIGAFCPVKTQATASVQVTEEVHEEAAQQLLDAIEQDDGAFYADLFLCESQEHRSASFQIKDGVNGGHIPKEWILLDSQSTTDAFSNPDLLKDIHEVRGSLTIHTQAGKTVTKLRGTVPGYGKVWYCPNGIANILLLAHVAKTRVVTFDSTNGNQFVVTKNDGTTRTFKQSQHGLYYYDMKEARISA